MQSTITKRLNFLIAVIIVAVIIIIPSLYGGDAGY